MRLLWMRVDAASPWPWLVAVAALARRLPAVPLDVAAWSRRRGSAPRAEAERMTTRSALRTSRRREALRRDADHPRRVARRAARRAARDHRAQRRRQVDAVQPDQRALRANAGLDPARRTGDRRRAALRDQPPRAWRGASRSPTSFRGCRCSRTCAAPCSGRSVTATASGATPTRSTMHAIARSRRSTRSGSLRGATCPQACSRTPSSARWRSASPSRAARARSCWTSRPRA